MKKIARGLAALCLAISPVDSVYFSSSKSYSQETISLSQENLNRNNLFINDSDVRFMSSQYIGFNQKKILQHKSARINARSDRAFELLTPEEKRSFDDFLSSTMDIVPEYSNLDNLSKSKDWINCLKKDYNVEAQLNHYGFNFENPSLGNLLCIFMIESAKQSNFKHDRSISHQDLVCIPFYTSFNRKLDDNMLNIPIKIAEARYYLKKRDIQLYAGKISPDISEERAFKILIDHMRNNISIDVKEFHPFSDYVAQSKELYHLASNDSKITGIVNSCFNDFLQTEKAHDLLFVWKFKNLRNSIVSDLIRENVYKPIIGPAIESAVEEVNKRPLLKSSLIIENRFRGINNNK